jgi:acetyltransferase
VAKAITDASREMPGKTVVAVLMGRHGLREWRAEMHANGIPTYIFPESAARGIAALNRHREMSQRPKESMEPLPVDRERAAGIIAHALGERRSRLDELEALNLLEAYGIPVVSARLAPTRDAAAAAACELGFPVAMKVVSPDVFHKSDVGGVSLGISGGRSAAMAYDRIITDVQRNAPGARIAGVLVEHQVDHGLEMIVGFKRDSAFGALVMLGLGGVFVEALKDVVFRIAPLSPYDVKQMLRGLRGAPLLNGIRGRKPIDRQALEEVILRASQLAIDFPQISELDINPILAFEHRIVAVDCRVALGSAV